MAGLFLSLGFIGWTIIVLFVGYMFGRDETDAYWRAVVEDQRETIVALTPKGFAFLDIEPGSREDLFNRADPTCELCAGSGRAGIAACPCTEIDADA